MNAMPSPGTAPPPTPFGRLRGICADSGLNLDDVRPQILERMRLLAETTETVRDCERAADLAKDVFRYYEARESPTERFTKLERRTVVIGTIFSDIGKTGPAAAALDGQRLVAEMFGIEHGLDGKTPVSTFFADHFAADASDRVCRFCALDLDPEMTMRAFWDLHSVWTLEILRGDGVPPEAVAAAATHHLLENVNPHPVFAADARLTKYVLDDAAIPRAAKLVIVLDKYDAARRRGNRTHDEAIRWLRQLVAVHPRFGCDRAFLELIAGLDAAVSAPLGSTQTRRE